MYFLLQTFLVKLSGSMSEGIRHSLQVSVVAISLLAAVRQVSAATYYIDYSAGSDSANGTSTSTPWQHFPGDPGATGTPGSTTLNSGDIVAFKGGVIYWATNTLSCSGVTYSGNVWGTGMAKMTAGFGNNTTFFNVYNQAGTTFTGLMFTNIGGYAVDDPIWSTTNAIANASTDGSGIVFQDCTNVTVSGCDFSRIGQWSNAIPFQGPDGATTGQGVAALGVSGLVITNCDFTCIGKSGINLVALVNHPATNYIITTCAIHNYINYGINISPGDTYGDTFDGILISNNWIHDYNEYDGGRWKGYGDSPHSQGIFIRTSAISSLWTNIVIANNKFSSDNPSGGGTASIFITQGPSATIINNLFLNDNHADAMVYLAYNKSGIINNYQYLKCYNNTFVGSKAISIDVANNNADLVDVRNNIFFRIGNGISDTAVNIEPAGGGQTVVWDYNLYYSDYSPLANWFCVYNGGWDVFTTWLAAWEHLDQHSLIASPGLTSLSGAASTWNVTPLPGSAVIGAGTNLTSLGIITMDYAGNARPATGAWDIGTYHYQATVSPPAPLVTLVAVGSPTNIIVGIPNIVQPTTLTWSSVNATNVTLSGFGLVPLTGSTNVSPSQTTIYTATATSSNGTNSASVSVGPSEPGKPQIIPP